MSNKTQAQILREWMDKINENSTPNDVEHIAHLCQQWLDSGYDMEPNDFNIILSSQIAQDCRVHSGGTIYRAIAPEEAKVIAFLKTKHIEFKASRPIVAYSSNPNSAQAAANFTKSGDEITLVFEKNAKASDIMLDFTKLLNKLREMGYEFSHSEDDDEFELWLDASNPYYVNFTEDEMFDADYDAIYELEARHEFEREG
jgi:hypothetical protein